MNIVSVVFFIIVGLFMIAAFTGLCVLQVQLSRKRSPGPGLILPIISIVLFLFIALPVFLFRAHTNQLNGLEVITNGPAISILSPKPDGMTDEEFNARTEERDFAEMQKRQMEEQIQAATAETATSSSAPILFAAFLLPLMFVPTLTFTVIYIVCRVSLRRNPPAAPGDGGYASPAEIRKMNIQDL